MRTEKNATRVIREAVRSMKRTVSRSTTDSWNRTGPASLRGELDGWLSCRSIWNHDDWLKLLGDLRMKGYSDLVDTPRGQDAIGLYLETNRRNASC